MTRAAAVERSRAGVCLPTSAQLQTLSDFDGDAVSAWRLHGALTRELLGEVGNALLLRDGPGPLRLVALTDVHGNCRIDAHDPFDQRGAALQLHAAPWTALASTFEPQRFTLAAADPLQLLLDCDRVLALPLFVNARSDHLLLLACVPGHALADADTGLLLTLANLFAAYLEGALDRRQLEEETLKAQVEIRDLADVQRLLLPDNPRIRGLEYAVHYQPCATAGGDYYDLMSLSRLVRADYPADWPDAFGLILADVSGHGAGAAMEAVQFDAILRTYNGSESSGPAGALTYANRHFFSRRARPHFMTVVSMLHLPHENRARICNAGHLPPLRRRDGAVERLQQGRDIPVGILRDHQFADEWLDTRSGDVIVFYTDGITEARDSSGREFGVERLIEILVAPELETPQALHDAILAALFAHQGGAVGTDDQSLLVVQLAAV